MHQGGTIIGTTNRGNPTAYPVQQDDGSWLEVDRTEELVGLSAANDIDALITVGGDGSLTIGARLHQAGLRVIGVPKTIDNDLDKTASTFGFDTPSRSPRSASTASSRPPPRTGGSSSSR